MDTGVTGPVDGQASGIVPPPAQATPTTPPPAPLRHEVGTWPMWVLGLVIMIDQMDQNIVRGVIPQLKDEFSITDAQVGLLMSAFVLVNGLVTVPAGYLADRWRRTRAIGHTVVGWSAITVVTAGAQSFAQLLGLRAVLGFGQAVTEPSAASLLGDYYPTEQRGRAFSLQQVLYFVGVALGVGLGGAIGSTLGWRWAFALVGAPGAIIAVVTYRLSEPRRGQGERIQLGLADDDGPDDDVPLFEHGFRRFVADMWAGLAADMRTILAIPTLKLALVGVGGVLFAITALAAWLPVFYERFHDLSQAQATTAFMMLVLVGGIPGILLGGRLADRYAGRIEGARVVIPAYCIWISMAFVTPSYLPVPFPVAFALQVVSFFVMTMAIPALRAGLTDVVPANLRGTGFGAFNLISVVIGAAGAPVVVGALADLTNLRVAFLSTTPVVLVGAFVLYRARVHLEADAAKIFEAVMRAIQEQQARDAEAAGSDGETPG